MPGLIVDIAGFAETPFLFFLALGAAGTTLSLDGVDEPDTPTSCRQRNDPRMPWQWPRII